MDHAQELHAIAQVVDRLAERFPHVTRARIERIVAEVQATLDDSRVRDYIPVLVERTAKDRLRRITAGDLAELASV